MDKRFIVLRTTSQVVTAINAIRNVTLDPEHPVEVIIQDHQSTRTLAQNRLCWKWNTAIRDHILESTGQYYTDEQVHYHFCEMFLPKVVEMVMGKEQVRQQTTSNLLVKPFSEYLNHIDHYCRDNLHLNLPHPEDLYYEAMRHE